MTEAEGVTQSRPRRWRRGAYRATAAMALATVLALASGLELVQPAAGAGTSAAKGSGGVTVVAITVPGYGKVLGTPRHMSLYLLSDERPRHITCTSGCLGLWPPLLLGAGVKAPRAGAGVSGRLGTIDRGRSRQVTYNGFPLYRYVGDTGPKGSAGQGIVANGGTWSLVRASAPTRASTPVRKSGS